MSSMELYTVDGLPMGPASAFLESAAATGNNNNINNNAGSRTTTATAPSCASGAQMVSLYRLFLSLHHAGTPTHTLQHVLKASSSVSDEGGDAKQQQQRTHGSGQPPRKMASVASSGQLPLPPAEETWGFDRMPDASGVLPVFALPARALPSAAKILKGYAALSEHSENNNNHHNHHSHCDDDKDYNCENTNRSANGLEELPVRVGLACGSAQQHPSPVLSVETSCRQLYCTPIVTRAADTSMVVFCCGSNSNNSSATSGAAATGSPA